MVTILWIKSLGSLNFLGKKEKSAIETITKEVDMVANTVKALEDVVAAAESRDWTLVEAASEKVSSIEEKVDLIHREGMVLISEGAFFAGIREDALNLLSKIDDVADYAKDASRVISQYPVPSEIYEAVFSPTSPIALIKKTEEGVSLLKQAVANLFTNPREAVRIAMEIERVEEEGDEVKNQMIKRIFAFKNKTDPLTTLELKDFVLWLDNVLDGVEDASDIIIVISAKSGV